MLRRYSGYCLNAMLTLAGGVVGGLYALLALCAIPLAEIIWRGLHSSLRGSNVGMEQLHVSNWILEHFLVFSMVAITMVTIVDLVTYSVKQLRPFSFQRTVVMMPMIAGILLGLASYLLVYHRFIS